MTAIIIKGRSGGNSLNIPSGLVAATTQRNTVSNTFALTPASLSFTNATFVVNCTPTTWPVTATNEILNNSDDASGQIPRLYAISNSVGFYFYDSYSNTGSYSIATTNSSLIQGKNSIIARISGSNGQNLELWLNQTKVNGTIVGTMNTVQNWNKSYRLSRLNGVDPFLGVIDFVGVWNRALTDSEIEIVRQF